MENTEKEKKQKSDGKQKTNQQFNFKNSAIGKSPNM